MKRAWFGSLALSVAALPLGVLMLPMPLDARISAALVLHIVASVGIAYALVATLPPSPAGRRIPLLALLVGVALFIPLLGAAGLATVVAPALRRKPTAARGLPLRVTRLTPLAHVTAQPLCASAIEALGRASRPADRLRAVIAARRLTDRLAVPLLAAALRDPADEVRLLAHAALGRRERALYGSIQILLSRAAAAEGRDQAMIHREVAHDYWELAFVGLAEGEVLRHVLGRARHHAEAALARLPRDGALHLLLGRVHLRDGFLDGAERALRRALACGVPVGSVVPWLAETAFRQRRLRDVRELMRALPVRRAHLALAGAWS